MTLLSKYLRVGARSYSLQPIRQTVHQVFDISRRLVVPLYQRAYVWEKEKHWEPLLEDIRAQAKSCFYNTESTGHFLGPIVTQTEMITAGGHPRYNIIDGQQRLTTLQLFLKALHLISAHYNHWATDEFERLIRNPPRPHVGPEEVFKVWPTNANRIAYRTVMEIREAKLEDPVAVNSKLIEGYIFFLNALHSFVSGIDEDEQDEGFKGTTPQRRIESLQQALTSKLYFIVLELEAGDDPQIIFETLNARGEPLLPSDLIRNDLFHRALRDHLDTDTAYNRYWAPFEEAKLEDPNNGEARFWHVMDTQGRLFRPRIDLFVFHWLTMKRAMAKQQDEMVITNLYQEFKKWTHQQARPAESIFVDLAENRDRYMRLISPSGKGRLSVTGERLRAIDTGTVYPLLLYLVGRFESDLENPDLKRILTALESYLIRRLLTNGTSKAYNRTFLSLLTKVASADPSTTLADLIERELLALKGPTVDWPDDDKLRRGIIEVPIYVKSRQQRVRTILIAVENHLRATSGTKTEEFLTNSELSIEHLLPQEATLADYPYAPKHYSENVIEIGYRRDETAEQARERLLHTLGNLTLLTQPLNSSISNGPFPDKRSEIADHSVLRLNKFLSTKSPPSLWNEKSIIFRSLELYEIVRAIWPIPKALSQ